MQLPTFSYPTKNFPAILLKETPKKLRVGNPESKYSVNLRRNPLDATRARCGCRGNVTLGQR